MKVRARPWGLHSGFAVRVFNESNFFAGVVCVCCCLFQPPLSKNLVGQIENGHDFFWYQYNCTLRLPLLSLSAVVPFVLFVCLLACVELTCFGVCMELEGESVFECVMKINESRGLNIVFV